MMTVPLPFVGELISKLPPSWRILSLIPRIPTPALPGISISDLLCGDIMVARPAHRIDKSIHSIILHVSTDGLGFLSRSSSALIISDTRAINFFGSCSVAAAW
jgi:hypothetical protein